MFNSITKTQAFFIGAGVTTVVYSLLDLVEARINDRLDAARLEQDRLLYEKLGQELSADEN